MAHSTLFALVALTSLTYVAGQSAAVPTFPQTPLVSLHFPYSSMPYQAVPQTYVRGTQFGYNQCNSSTENQNSLCQDIFVNGISDFCFFAPPKPNSTISDTEAEEVSWCSKKGHGTRGIPPGTITGIQVLVNSNYIQYVAHIKQENVNVASGDFGGELDSGGQDELGNPMGGLCYSTAFSSDNTTYEQIASWNVFLGGNLMGMKICNPSGSNPRVTANIPLIASVLLTTCPTMRRMVFSKCAILILWIFLGCTPRADKHYPTPSPLSHLARSHRFPILLASLPVRTVKRIRVLRSTPTSSMSQPTLRLVPRLQLRVMGRAAVVLARVARLSLLLPVDLTARELSLFLFSRVSLVLHSRLHSLRKCMCLMS